MYKFCRFNLINSNMYVINEKALDMIIPAGGTMYLYLVVALEKKMTSHRAQLNPNHSG